MIRGYITVIWIMIIASWFWKIIFGRKVPLQNISKMEKCIFFFLGPLSTFPKMSLKFVHNFLTYCVHRQTESR